MDKLNKLLEAKDKGEKHEWSLERAKNQALENFT